ncbi:MAG: alpha-glucan family phosphorylase, partial [Candidatus Spechtbacterales bacterium]|nr:alpha-glucan family phosphorylase [Candidatus Spechtbacterales bacterium]
MKDDNEILAARNCFPYEHIKTDNPSFSELQDNPVAFFCSEYGLEQKLPIYAGGLGVLAGDFVLTAGEMDLPLVAIGLMYNKGFPAYGKEDQELNPQDGGFSILKNDEGREIILDIEAGDDVIYARVWVRAYNSAHVFLLDTDIERNPKEYRAISHYLYSTDFPTKLLQDFMLGVGGVKLLRCLDIQPKIYHANEGHASFVMMALAVEYMHDNPDITSLHEAIKIVKRNIVGTKHTILSGAGLHFDRETLMGIVDKYLKRHGVRFEDFFVYGADKAHGEDIFSTTKLLITGSARANAVSLLHATFEKRDHPHSKLLAITNGVCVSRWRAPEWGDRGIGQLTDKD